MESVSENPQQPSDDDDAPMTSLDLTSYQLHDLDSVDLPSSLTELDLTANRLTKLDPRIALLSLLNKLSLRQNLFDDSGIEPLSRWDNLSGLEILRDNKLTNIPDVSIFKNLIVFDVSFNEITSSSGLSKLCSTLKELYLSKNEITKIEEIEHLHELQILELGSNKLRVMENLETLVKLQELWLGRNRIKAVNLCGLKCIKKLSLQSNRLTSMKGFEECVALEELYLSHNGIPKMEGLSTLVNLRGLDVSSNKLTSLDDIEKLPSLEDLWLNDNQIATLEDMAEKVHGSSGKLTTIYLEHNPCSSFFAHFMCFEVPALNPPGTLPNGNKPTSNVDDPDDDDDLGIMDIDDNDGKAGKNSLELAALNECLQELLDGIQEDFYAVVDWAYKIDPLRCISMHGITERYLSGQKADAAGFVRLLLGDLESRISMQFSRFVDEACHQIERNERNVRQMGVLSYIPRFAILATRMDQYIQGQSRDLVDQAYTKFVSIMFVTLEKISQTDPKYADVFLLENYAAFQNSLYDLANVVPTLAKFYHQASESYEQACTRHISMIIYYQFERLFQFARRIEDLMYTLPPEDMGLSKSDLRKVLRASLSGVDKSIQAMYKKLQKNLTSEELLPSLWDKCKKEFLDKYESFAQLVAKVYPTEKIPTVEEIRDLLASL